MVELLPAAGVPAEAAEADAEGMKHHASGAALEAFARFLAR
jgi:DtxR family manganese transport transcriptional regulator